MVQDGVLAGHNWSLINYSYSESRQELSANSSNIGKALVRPYAPKMQSENITSQEAQGFISSATQENT